MLVGDMLKGKRAPLIQRAPPGVGTSSSKPALPPQAKAGACHLCRSLASSSSFLQDIVLMPVATTRAWFFQPSLWLPSLSVAPSSSVHQLTAAPGQGPTSLFPSSLPRVPSGPAFLEPMEPFTSLCLQLLPCDPSLSTALVRSYSSFEIQPACPFAPVTVSCTPLLWLWAGSPESRGCIISSSSLGSSAVSGML